MVPLLLIRTNVMMAIRISGIDVPPMVSANTSLGFGHGTVVDIRTVMYESRKQLKTKVWLRREIHFMAFPQDTFLNARWSDDQSATIPWKPPGRVRTAVVCIDVGCVICSLPPLVMQQQREEKQPDEQEEVPIDCAQLDA